MVDIFLFLCSGCGHLASPLRARARRHRDDRQRLRVQGLRRHLVSERTHDGVRRVARQQPGRFAAQRLRGPALQVRLGRGRITELVPQLLDLQLEEAAGAGRPHGLDLAPQPLPPPGVEAKFNSEILKPFYFVFFSGTVLFRFYLFFRELFRSALSSFASFNYATKILGTKFSQQQ